MLNRLEFFSGQKVVVYCNGRESKDWVSCVNSAFLLKDILGKNTQVQFVVKDKISGYPD